MADQDEMIQQFSAVSGADTDRAKFFLESAAWNLSTALSSFFEEEGEDSNAVEASNTEGTTAAAAATATTAPISGSVNAAASGLAAAARGGGWPSDDSEEEEGQAFYTGGSQHSGQQVLGPPRKKKDVVANLFKAAKEHGAEVVESKGGHKTVRTTFQGTSYRLGETLSDTQVIPGGSSGSRGGEQPEPVELRMWRTGFTINDGPLREYQDEESMRFLADIKNGRIPLELVKASGGREVAINMADHHHEDYVPSKVSRKAFTGSGQTLGSPAPSVVGQVPHVPGPGGSANKPPVAPADPKAQEEQAKKQLNVDTSQPTTSVQIRLTDGSRIVVRANHTQTVADLRSYVVTARPEYGAQHFALMTTFPHAELAQPDLSLFQANLLNSAIVLKIK